LAQLGRNDPCWCGSGRKLKYCHREATVGRLVPAEIVRPHYVNGRGPTDRPEPMVKDADTIERMRRTGRLAADVLAAVAATVRPGITTDELDATGHQLAVDAGAYPSPLGYGPKDNLFPKSICTSVNEVICHGIPAPRVLTDGDLVSIDVTVFREGVHGDTCVTVPVGDVDDRGHLLIASTREALAAAIAAVRAGEPLRAAGQAIQAVVERDGLGIARDFVGHGVGQEFHTPPTILHYDDARLTTKAELGMTFTIEPMITEGSWDSHIEDDGWTAVTVDGSRCAQFEHTLVVTGDGAEILTTPSDPSAHPYWA
jgi:methionyl aminopeptidase